MRKCFGSSITLALRSNSVNKCDKCGIKIKVVTSVALGEEQRWLAVNIHATDPSQKKPEPRRQCLIALGLSKFGMSVIWDLTRFI